MRTATGLTLVAIGAILAIAVTAQPSFINLHVAGFVIALTGVAGLLVPRRTYGWLRRRVTVRRGARGQTARVEEAVPPYLMVNPGAEGPPPDGPQPGDITAKTDDPVTNPIQVVQGQTIERRAAEPAGTVPPAEETIEEFIEE
ncbi:MAG TPA: hypothetical protein VH641_12730 [Streptosporangiaceae bacterium]|jgi:hypothetical protein